MSALTASPPAWASASALVVAAAPGSVLGTLAFASPSVELWGANAIVALCGWVALAARRAIGPLAVAALYLPTLAAAFAWIDLVFPGA